MFDAVKRDDLSAVKVIVEAGADVNAKDSNGEPVLQMSISKGIKKIKYLLEAGADPNMQDNNGNTALHNAIYGECFNAFYWGRLDAAQLLLKHRADMYIKNNKGETAYVISVLNKRQDITEFLMSHGYVPSKEDLQLIADRNLYTAVQHYVQHYYSDLIVIQEAVKAGADIIKMNVVSHFYIKLLWETLIC